MTLSSDPFTIALEGDTLRLKALDSLSATHVAAQRAFLKESLDKAGNAVVLDLGSSELVDSLGITLIVGLYKSCKERGLAFSVEGANAETARVFTFFGLDEIFATRTRPSFRSGPDPWPWPGTAPDRPAAAGSPGSPTDGESPRRCPC